MQNEPGNNARWEACVFSNSEANEFIGMHLGPALRASHPEVLLFAWDHNKDHVYSWGSSTLSDPVAAQYVDGIAFHWYAGDHFDQLKRVQQQFPQTKLLSSEQTYERFKWHPGTVLSKGDWSFGEGYAHEILGDLNAGAIGWIDWNMILDENGGPNHVNNFCDATMMANLTVGELYFHPQYYFIAHFSKFILRDSKLLVVDVTPRKSFSGKATYACSKEDGPNCRGYGVCTEDDGLQATAFLRPDGQVVVVVLNCGGAAIEFKLRARGHAVLMTIPGHAIQTYLLDPREGDPIVV